MKIFYIIKVKILVLIKWSYGSPHPWCLLSLEWLAYAEHVDLSLLNTYLFGVCFYVLGE